MLHQVVCSSHIISSKEAPNKGAFCILRIVIRNLPYGQCCSRIRGKAEVVFESCQRIAKSAFKRKRIFGVSRIYEAVLTGLLNGA